MSVLPEKIVTELRGLPIVQSLNYSGYSYDEADKTEEDLAEADEAEGEDDETTAKKGVIKMEMTIAVKGDQVDIFKLTPQAEEEAAK